METMAKIEEIKQVKETLFSWLREEVGHGKDCIHLESSGDVTDMIKDLAETEKECMEALYYMTVISAMQQGEEPYYGDSMGYNHRHTNSGRFASAGRGHVVGGHHSGSYGYHHGPFMDQTPYVDGYLHDPNFEYSMENRNKTMGYDDGRMSHNNSKYGKAYEDYREARRHYTTSKNVSDKEEMNHHIMEHLGNSLESLQEMWEASDDTMLKKRFLDEMSKVFNQMKASAPK